MAAPRPSSRVSEAMVCKAIAPGSWKPFGGFRAW